jgi:predicted kinase
MIILVFGLPGTGKSYLSRCLQKNTGSRYLNTDIIREEIDKKGNYSDASKEQVYNLLAERAKNELAKGFDIIVDGTFHKRDRRQMLSDIAGETGQKIYFIEVRASEQTVAKRLKKKREYSEADYRVYKQLKKEFEPFPDNHLILWSDMENTSEMIGKARKYIYGY